MTDTSLLPIADHKPAGLTDFAPVPRKLIQPNGWSPGRQKAFIEALAETASVRRAAQEVNMSPVSCYQLRNHPQGGEFRKAWDAALECGLAHLKDVAFERAVEGQLEPVFVRGELKGYRRKFSDRLLMFLLRQYGQDSDGRRVTVTYARAQAGTSEAGGDVAAEAGSMTVQTKVARGSGQAADPGAAAAVIDRFAGVSLDAEAEAEIAATLAACAARKREIRGTADDLSEVFIPITRGEPTWQGSFEPEGGWIPPERQFAPEETPWEWSEAEVPDRI